MSCFKYELVTLTLLVVLQVRWKGKDQLSDYVSNRHRGTRLEVNTRQTTIAKGRSAVLSNGFRYSLNLTKWTISLINTLSINDIHRDFTI